MILNSNLLTKGPEFFKRDYEDYTLLNTGFYEFPSDTERLEQGIIVYNLCNCMRIINTTLKKAKLADPVDYDILFDVLRSIQTDAPLSNEKMIEYLTFNRRMEEICTGFQEIAPAFTEVMYVYSETNLTLIGFNYEDQKNFNFLNKDVCENAKEEVQDLLSATLKGEFPLEDFKSEALELINTAYQKAKTEGRKAHTLIK